MKMCSCDSIEIGPLQGKCLTKSVVYNTEVIITGRPINQKWGKKATKTWGGGKNQKGGLQT